MLPRDLAEFLIVEGHEASTTSRLKLHSDESIWRHAESIQAVVISKDSDYIPLASQLAKAQFVHLRMGNLTTSELLDRFRLNLPQILQAILAGEKIIDVK
jgi:predicted nuclease of predicted toxin-antitoxin system